MSINALNGSRVQYIEPTNLFKEREGSYSDGITYPYEDYCMAVDLTIEMGNRFSCGYGVETGDRESLRYSTNNGTLSLMGGTRGYESTINEDDSYLTVNYTDISMMNPEDNTAECLGIESISISYNSWFYPQVVIKFVDVRGATVLQPAEKNYYNENGGNTSAIYKALFSFPYPIFKLKVKGFYGKGVTYKLAVEKTSIEFDSNTGNFNITANFIGYMYGIYADMPMTYLAIAPYTLNGRQYWAEKIADGTFYFKDADGVAKEPMMTIPKLRERLAKAAENEEALSAAQEGEKMKGIYDERKNKIGNLLNAAPFQDWFKDEETTYTLKTCASSGETTFTELQTSVSGYVESVSGYDYTYKTTYLNRITPLVNYALSGVGMGFFNVIKDGDKITPVSYIETLTKGKIKTYQSEEVEMKFNEIIGYSGATANYVKQGYKNLSQYTVAVFNLGRKNIFEDIRRDLVEEEKQVNAEKIKEEKYYRDKKDSIIEKVLGFRPSIRNIYELMFAHMDTFLTCFYGSMNVIKDELDTKSEKRKKSHYDIKDGETDTEREKIKTSNGSTIDNLNERSSYLPPYTAYYKEEYSPNETKKVLKWPEELLHGNELEEVRFVKELLSASELYADDNQSVEELLATMASAATEEKKDVQQDKNAPSTTVYDFIPITTYDYINKDNMSNPYEGILEKVNNNSDDLFSEIIGIFFTRMYYYQLVNRDIAKNMAKIGQLDAINLYKVVRDKYTNKFCDFIKQCVEVFSDSRSNSNDCLREVLTSKENNFTRAWRPSKDTKNLNNYLFCEIGNNVSFDYHRECEVNDGEYKFFPLNFHNFNELKNAYAQEEDLINNPKFLALYNDGEIYNDSNVSTFSVFESRHYLDNIINSIETEIEKASKIEGYGNRGASDYGDLAFNVGNFKFLRNNILKFSDVDYNDDMYKKETFCTIDGKEPWFLNTIENAIENGKDLESYYIKIPTKAMYNGNVCKIFNHPFYKAQTDINVKACLFLQSLNYGDNNPWNIKFQNRNEHMLKSHLLLEGSMYWLKDNENLIKYTYEGDGKKVLNVKRLKDYEVFITGNVFNVIYDGQNNEYLKWKEPLNNTSSRRKFLKNFFLEWVNGSNENTFKANESYLTSEALYINKKNSVLNIKDLLAEDKQSNDAIKGRKLQNFLRDLYFGVCLTLDLYNNNGEASFNYGCETKRISRAFYGFFKQLHKIYGEAARDMEKDEEAFKIKTNSVESTNPFKNNDIRLTTYMTLKSLYDKWLCNPYKGAGRTWKLSKNRDSESDFDSFIYVDTFYHDIGYKLSVNVTKVSSWLSSCIPTSNVGTDEGSMGYNGKTVYEFLAEVAQDCGGMLLALPQKFGLQSGRDIEQMFKPISLYDDWDDDSSTFVFMYTYKPSEHLGSAESSNLDMNGWSPDGDGLDLSDGELVGKLLSDSGYTIPAFGVTYAKQNQTIFKNVKLSTESNGVTEAGLAATFNIASKSSESPRESTLYGQDLYRVFSSYSYKCSAEMMGNMQITPLMYFQLNNVPLWKGAYTIIKVTHEITAGNINTIFEGVRINRYAIPFADSSVVTLIEDGERSGGRIIGDRNPISGSGGMVMKGKNPLLNIDGDITYTPKDTLDIKDVNNVTPQKPVICLTPAHGPSTEKKQEWEWSSKVVDRIVQIFREDKNVYKFKDGTSFIDNVQRCNKPGGQYGAKNTGVTGYSMRETENMIKKFGSNCVISVVPHWNGGAGDYHLVMINKKSAGNRQDTLKFADCMLTEMKKINENSYDTIPVGMMKGGCRITNLGEANTDGAPNQQCACLLTENWFADFPKGCKWFNDNVYSDKNNDNRYNTGRGWLMADGIEVIARAHANGIKRYIDTL